MTPGVFTLKERLTWMAAVLIPTIPLIWGAIAAFYKRDLKRADDIEKDLSQKLENQEADLENCRDQLHQVKDNALAYHQSLETERSMRQSQDQEFQKEKVRLQEGQAERERELEEQIQTLIRGEVGTSKVIEWEGLFQIKLTSYIPQTVNFSRDWIGVRGGPLEKYKVQYDSVIRPEDGPLTFDLRRTEDGAIMKWVQEQGGDIAKKHKMWIYQLENHFQVVVKSLMEGDLEGDISIRSNGIPLPNDRLMSRFSIGPNSEALVITQAG
jgi:hypothetical protein